MASTAYSSGVTIASSWLNDVNAAVYTLLGVTPASIAAQSVAMPGALTVAGNVSLGAAQANTLSIGGSVYKNAAGSWVFPAPTSGVTLTATSVGAGGTVLNLIGSGSTTLAMLTDATQSVWRAVSGTVTADFYSDVAQGNLRTNSNHPLTISTNNIAALKFGTNQSVLAVSPTGGLGYGTGAGNSVTQITSKATGVTLNNVCGQITTNNAALGAGAIVSFLVTNSTFAAEDVVTAMIVGATSLSQNYQAYGSSAESAGSFTISLKNVTAGSLSDSVIINFLINKCVKT